MNLRAIQAAATALLLAPLLIGASIGAPTPTATGGSSNVKHKIQITDPSLARQILAQGGRLIADYGGYQLIETSASIVGLTNEPLAQIRDEYNVIQLHAAKLDTSKPETQALRKTAGAFPGKRLHLVQFAGPVQPTWRDELLQSGAEIVSYIPENAYLVYADAAGIASLQSWAASVTHVQWEGSYLDDYKIHPAARLVDAQGNPRQIGTDVFAIQLVADSAANGETLRLLEGLRLEPYRRTNLFQNYLNIVVRVAPGNLPLIAAQPEVVAIHPYFPRKKFCERQDQIIAGNLSGTVPSAPGYLAWLATRGFTQAQFTNSGFAVDITDSGLDNGTPAPNHAGLHLSGLFSNASRVIYNRLEGFPNFGSTLKGCDGHGTLNSHIIMGFDDAPLGFPHTDAQGYHFGLGVCPFVKIGSSVIFDPDNFTSPDYSDLQSEAYHDGARVSNNSWGADVFGDYDIDSQEYDALVRDAQPSGSTFPVAGNQEMVIVFANGNAGQSGAQTVGSPATAKNVISVGASENVQSFGQSDGCGITDSQANSADDIIFFSSRGPCSDGRRKPEIVAPGTHVSGGVAQLPNGGANGLADPCFDATGVCGLATGNFYPAGQQLFTVSSGTSHSTPGVVGGCALLRQYFINNFGGPPSPAMTKAMLMNSARYLTGANANDPLWSNNQGMGEMNLGFAFDGAPRMLRDELAADLFTASGQTRVFTGAIADPSKPFRVTVAWTDAPGSLSGNAYKNNLDLSVSVGGNTYKGNVFGSSNSVTGGSADSRNNAESVFLPAGAGATFTVTITAVNINSDGVPGNGNPLDQDFALVIYNSFVPTPPVLSPIQPTNTVVLPGQSAAFSITAQGSPPLVYQWRLNGTNVPGATTNAYSIASVQPNDSGNYTVLVTNLYGSATSGVATLTVVPTVPIPFALNNSNLTFITNTAVPWYGQTNVSHDGIASVQTWLVGDGQQAILSAATNGPATLSFYWKVSSQTNADTLTFSTNGTGLVSISGEVDWQQRTFYLPAGGLALNWTYAKDSANSAGQDKAWVDQVTYTLGGTAPFILAQPASQASVGGSPVAFAAAADGTPSLGYQWLFNGASLPGATTTTLAFPTPLESNGGAYSLRVTNAYGAITSSVAFLGVVPLALRGDNGLDQLNVTASATNVAAIAAGSWHNLVLRKNGTVTAWGNNGSGQCNVPTNLAPVAGIAAGGYHSLALTLSMRVVGWGDNFYGQAGSPPGLSNVVSLAAGFWHSLALRADGTVAAWGDDSSGQTDIPSGLASVTAIAAGGNHSLALRSDGSVVAWGENTDSQGSYSGQSIVPADLNDVVAIGAGEYHSLAVKSDGTVVAWGDNSQGQTAPLDNLTNIVLVAGGGAHSLALQSSGTIIAWGNDLSGQCDFPASLSNVTAIAAGTTHSLLLLGSVSAAPQPLFPSHIGARFTLLVQTIAGKYYALEYKDALNAAAWTPLPEIRGDGAPQFLIDPSASGPRRFYRVKQR